MARVRLDLPPPTLLPTSLSCGEKQDCAEVYLVRFQLGEHVVDRGRGEGLHDRPHPVLHAELEHLLILVLRAQVAPADPSLREHQGLQVHALLLRLLGQADAGHHAVRLQKREVPVHVRQARYRVQDHVEAAGVAFHLLRVSAQEELRRAEVQGHLLRRRGADCYDSGHLLHVGRNLDRDVPQPADPDDADDAVRLRDPALQRGVRGDPGAQERGDVLAREPLRHFERPAGGVPYELREAALVFPRPRVGLRDLRARVLPPCRTLVAGAAAAALHPDPDHLANAEVAHARAHLVDRADDLVARD
mmetsp:Transcript_89628/g.254067  ORF Transcript_89628/g.254067 Transcript_89628/m.254067 type:complete len:304 (-) Transcript_89628:244-1155(-)